MLDQIISAVGSYKPVLRKLSDALWQNPETAFNEVFAAENAAACLQEAGFSVTKPYCGIETAFRS